MLSTAYCPAHTTPGTRHHTPAPARHTGGVCHPVAEEQVRAVIAVDRMPKTLRLTIEQAMSVCLKSQPEPAPAGADPFDLGWCTRWVSQPGGLTACRQTVTATAGEIDHLQAIVEGLARSRNFSASVRLV